MEAGVRARRSFKKRLTALVIGASLVGVLGAAVPSQAAKVNGYIISIPGNASLPFPTARVVATVGSKVIYRNLDVTQHNVYFSSLGIGSPYLGLNGNYSFIGTKSVTKKKGTFNFVCQLHPAMKGQLIVK